MYIQIDFGSVKEFKKIRWGRDEPGGWNDRVPQFYTLTVSEDGSEWIEIAREYHHSFDMSGYL